MQFFFGKQENSANVEGVLLGKPIRISVSGRCGKLRVPIVSTNGSRLGGKRVPVGLGFESGNFPKNPNPFLFGDPIRIHQHLTIG